MKRFLLLALLTGALVLVSLPGVIAANPSASASVSPASGAYTLGVYDDRFEPKILHVPIGADVLWLNYGTQIHTVTSRDGMFDSGELVPGRGFSMTFMQPGIYPYFCRHHQEMSGVIVVGE